MQSQAIPLRTLQIIVAALAVGVVVFLGVALAVAPTTQADESSTTLTPILLGVAVVAFITQMAVLSVVRRRAEARLLERKEVAQAEVAEGRVPQELATITILGAAFGEGLALLGVVTYLLEARSLALFVVGFGLAVVVTRAPTRDSVKERVDGLGRVAY